MPSVRMAEPRGFEFRRRFHPPMLTWSDRLLVPRMCWRFAKLARCVNPRHVPRFPGPGSAVR